MVSDYNPFETIRWISMEFQCIQLPKPANVKIIYLMILEYTQVLHVWNIYLHLGHFLGKCR